MTNFEPGDILEIALTSNQPHPDWAGLTIAVTTVESSLITGTVLKPSIPDNGYPAGTTIRWSAPHAFTHVKAKSKEQPQPDKYLSPFSGRWT